MMSDRNSSRRDVWSKGSRKNVRNTDNRSRGSRRDGITIKMRWPAADRLPDRRGQAVQEIIADLKIRAGRIITTVRLIAGVAALPSLAAGTLAIVNALREALAGRTIDLRKITLRRTLVWRRPVRMRKITGTMINAAQIRTGINGQGRIISMRKMRRQ